MNQFTIPMKLNFPNSTIFLFLFGASLLLFTACQKDDSTDDTTINDDPNNDDPFDPAEVGGRFSNFLSCEIIAPPNEVNLNSYYKKYLNCGGIPIIGSDAVPDEAMYIAEETLNFMLNGLNSIKTKLISDGNYIALYPEGSNITELPDPFVATASNGGAYTWSGPGANDLRALASDVSSLICNPDIGFGHILVHEIAHMIHIGGILRLDSGFQSELEGRYGNAMSSGKWNNTYASTNPQEYLAEAATIWYGVNWIGPVGGDGWRNEIGTRAELQNYDSGIFNLLNGRFNSLTDVPGCRIPVISNTSADCPETIVDIDGNVYEIINIGPLCWLKENLKTTRYNDGTPIPNLEDYADWQNTSSGAWAYYENDSSFGDVYGKIYNGHAFTSGKLCPEGWHVPNINELQSLVNYAGGDHQAVNLRSTDLWNASDFPGTNSSGATARPGGVRVTEGYFNGLGGRTNFGSSSSVDAAHYYSKAIFDNTTYVYTDNTEKTVGTSCRCVKD